MQYLLFREMTFKNMIKNIIYILLAFVLCGCLNKEDITDNQNGKVNLNFSLEGGFFTKDGSAVSYEDLIRHLDIYMFRADGTKILYERKNVSGAPSGSTNINGITLEALKIEGNVTVCVVANSTNPQSELANIGTYANLRQTIETTTYINITGYTGFEGDYPKTFLMTGESTKNFSDINVNENHTISIVLYRAAAKVEIHFVKKSDSKHIVSLGEKLNDDTYSYADNSYYIRNLRYQTPYWGYATLEKRKTSPLTNSGYMVYNKSNSIDEVVVTTYIYSYSWGGDNASSIFEDAPFMIVNLPAMVKNYDNSISYNERNYYEIPLRVTPDNSTNTYYLERNHHYVITANVDAPGAQTDMDPVELVPVHYKAYPWNSQDVNIGTEGPDVNYLYLNQNAIEMHNTETNNEIRFASSSAIESVTLKEAYYINKYGTKVTVRYPKAEAEQNVMNGTITVKSELSPTVDKQKIDNVVIYMTFTVTNQTGKSAEFTVTQYPTVYIQGVLGSFSYRTDFGANWADGRGTNGYISVEWKNNKWNYYSTHTQYTTFQSKKAGDKIDNNGQATMRYYYWQYDRKSNKYNIKYNDYHSGNPRMYHVTITSTDEDYHIGRPLLDSNGYTDRGSDNLVSPSFMIASSLGAVSSFTNFDYSVAAQHCSMYAEAYYDSNNNLVKLEDWRLPTSAEIGILVKYQQNSVAMDQVITGSHYMTASGEAVATNIAGANQGVYVRCVRDEYKRPAK